MPPKKSILFVINNLNVGGVEKSLLSLLRVLPPDRFDIHLGVINATGGLLDQIPSYVKLFEIPELRDNISKVRGKFGALMSALKEKRFADFFRIPFLYLVSKFSRTLLPLYSYYIPPSSYSLPTYDIAVSFQGPSELLDYYVAKVVRTKRKFGWIHFDIDKFFIRRRTTLLCYSEFERIMVVSENGRKAFCKRFPSLADRCEVMLNIIDKPDLHRLASEPVNLSCEDPAVINIVTVGRLAKIKGQELAIRAARILKDRNIPFHWYFIGDGDMKSNLLSLVARLGLLDEITFTGSLSNPYPYMAACDVYVQPSVSEGYGIALGESLVFGVPIVATDFIGAREQLSAIPNSIIIPHRSPLLLADAIIKVSALGPVSTTSDGNPPQLSRLLTLFS